MEEQKRFVSDASHELRTPLTALKTSIEVNMKDKEFQAPAVQDLLKRNLFQIDKLQALTDNLLVLARYQTVSKIPLHNVSLDEVIRNVVDKLQSLADKNSIQIKLSTFDIEIQGDKDRLSELFTILLDNAIKYSPDNETITITSFSDPKRATISIQDNGVGIAKKDLPLIFDRFYRAETARTKEGYGLGLSIAKSIVEMHKGNIFVESEKNKGTKFTIQLPLGM